MTEADELFRLKPVERVPKPWGYELIFGKTEHYAGKILHVRAGECLSLQYHEVKEETLYLVRGELRLTLQSGEERCVITMREGEAFHIPPRLIHRMEAVVDSDIAEVSTPELHDVVRLEDRYGRAEGKR